MDFLEGGRMNLLETILNSNGGSVTQIAKQLGIPDTVAKQAVSALTPALARGLQRNASQPGGLDSLLGALGSGNHQQYVDNPATLGDQASVADGNAILGHILGSKDVSRNVAGAAAQETGLDSDVLKKMLPMLAGVAMGALSKQTNGGNQLSALPASGQTGSLGALTSFLDAEKDGSATDDLLDLAKKFF
jgi:hypothetical protein